MPRDYPDKSEAVYYYGTCLADLFFPEAGLAGVQLLQREGIRVIYPPNQTCCGQPAFNSGYREDAKAVIREQVVLFSKDIPIVVPSGSCAAMMCHHYPSLFEGDPLLPDVEAFAARTYELTEYLVRVMGIRLVDRGEPIRVAWHASCHALREMGLADEGKALVRQLDNVELVELERERECCGFGGTFAVKQPHISAAMVEDKAKDIECTGAAEFLAADAGCLMNIGGFLKRRGSGTRARHIAQFLWERTRDE